MDINALLSPDDSSSSPPESSTSRGERSPSNSPRKSAGRVRPGLGSNAGSKRTASGSSKLSQELQRSPDRTASPTSNPASAHATPSAVYHQPTPFNPQPGAVPNFRPAPTSVPAPDSHARHSYAQQQRPVVAHRPSSTPQMETLDLASVQLRPQSTRTYSANSVARSDFTASSPRSHQHTPLIHAAPPIARSISRQSLADLTMAEAPAQTPPPPRDFTSSALSEAESKSVTDLLSFLAENSYAYDSHVELINLLHKGFLTHISPPADSGEAVNPGDPHSYALLTELRQAREAMDTRFAVGEDIWLAWLSDEIMLARSAVERVGVTELCSRAVQDEPASVKLWLTYVDWVSSNHAACHNLEGADERGWTEDDKELCRDLFTEDMLWNVLEQAIFATKWRIDASHVIWNRYAQAVQDEVPQSPLQEDVRRLHTIFFQRLQVPHASWDDTMQLYWPIISRFEGNNWEALVAQVHQEADPAKQQMRLREEHEFKLQRAMGSGDKESIRHEFEKYLKSEKFHHKRPGPFDYNLRCALYERALLRFPTATEWWLDYTDFAITASESLTQSLLPLIERATRHCPWSGDLWARRILRADVEKKSREEIEEIKHRATNAGLIDVGGLEELVKMLQQWCSYLRRHAFRETASEDDLDTAEVGITMALEDVQQAGKKIYGESFQGDPLFRLEQVQVKFYTEARRFDDARAIYRQLIPQHGNFYEFWAKYYSMELWLWGWDRIRETRRVETVDNGPNLASEVTQEALRQKNLDWPEKVLEMYLYHFQQHESGSRLQSALVDAREFANRLTAKRAREAEEAAQLAAQQQEQQAAAMQETENTAAKATAVTGEKRKRDEEELTNGDAHKKSKPDTETNNKLSEADQIKRDREHTTITVRNLPTDVSELDIKKFFRDCGKVNSINILRGENGDAASATVEFESLEDVTAAKTRSGKDFDGCEVRIHSGGQNTLYVTNYPAEYDEDTIRGLFKSYGEIISVRLPSLKFNSRRRFCYVQYLTAGMAKEAEKAMDGKKLDGRHTLLAKISDPDHKKQRGGAQVEGREIIVKNLDREAHEGEIKEFFSQYGPLEKVNLLRLVNNKLTGTGFFVYSSTDQASAAVEGANNKPFHDRIIKVEISTPKGRPAPVDRARIEDVLVKKPDAAASTSPEPGARRGSDVSMTTGPPASEEAYRTAKERKVAIFNIPDTVNDARIRTSMERYGPITKIQLRREKEGAIVEFAASNDAFNVRQGVDVTELGPLATTGFVGALLKIGNHKKPAATNGSGPAPPSSNSLAFVPPAALRPGQGRGKRRGGLGFKRGGAFASAARNDTGDAAASSAGAAKKSNADFRSMLEASKKTEDAAADDAE